MANFCGKCGTKLDEKTNLCPKCDATEIAKQKEAEKPKNKIINNAQQNRPANKSLPAKQMSEKQKKSAKKKADKLASKRAKKADKKAKKAARSPRQKAKVFLIKLVSIVLALIIVVSTVSCLLVYFGVADVPVASEIMQVFGFKNNHNSKNNGAGDSKSSLYVPDDNTLALDEKTGIMYINNIVLIFFKEGITQQQVNEVVSSINGEIVGSIPAIDQYQVKIKTSTLDELKAICQEIKKNEFVFDATYDVASFMDKNAIPNDTWDNSSWSEANPDESNWWVEAVGAVSAWDLNDKLEKINIGVVDNGFDTGHEDLKNVIKSTSPVNDKAKHGTHVAGIIGAEANNNKGISGLVWNCEMNTWDWQLNGIQNLVNNMFNLQWSTSNQILGGTVNLVENGSKVINLSAGQTSSLTGTTRSDEDVNAQGHNASLYLYSLLCRNYDFLIVQSAGNGNSSGVSLDAVYNGLYCSINESNCVSGDKVSKADIINRVVVVGAAQNDKNNRYSQPEWSNAGSRVDICAPGVDVYSTVPGGLSGEYEKLSGTSMAAPVVTGVASLTWAANSSLTGAEVKKIICDRANTRYNVADNTSTNHPLSNSYRLINAELSIKAALKNKNQSSNKPSNPSNTNKSSSSDRDIMLVLDTSGSMSGTPISETRKAAVKFVDTILDSNANIGIVTYNGSAKLKSDFSNNKSYLESVINDLDCGGSTNIDDGLCKADEKLSQSSAKKKIIVLMSDGMPNEGRTGDNLVNYAEELKEKGIYIYTLGFFEKTSDKTEPQALMEKIASEGCHYEVSDADSLVFFFGDIADQISGQKYIYVRIACPVDVSVTHNGETLNSSNYNQNTRTSFGTLTFEETDSQSENGSYYQDSGNSNNSGGIWGQNGSSGSSSLTGSETDSRVKILRLKEGEDYDIKINGNGFGTMNYSIGFMNENGDYSDFRRFNNISINSLTRIDTVAKVSDKTVLNVDENGDGKYDVTYEAKANSYGEIVDYSYVVYIIIGAVAVVVILILILIIRIKVKKRRRSVPAVQNQK